MEPQIRELEHRLARAERTIRAMRWMVIVTLLVVISVLLAAPAATRNRGTTLRAPLKVVDHAGKTLLQLDTYREREGHIAGATYPRLRLFHFTGKAVVDLRAHDYGGALSLGDTIFLSTGEESSDLSILYGPGKVGAPLTVSSDSSSLGLVNNRGKYCVVLYANNDGDILVSDETGKIRFKVP